MHQDHDRLVTLERRLRHTRWMLGLLVASGVVLATTTGMQKAGDKLKVQELTASTISTGGFTLRDGQGRPRVSIQMGSDGGPFVALLDEQTKVRLLLSLHENQHPLVQVSDPDESPQISMFHNSKLGAGLTMQGTAGQTLLAVPTGGPPRLELSDGQGKRLFAAP